jgi:hypothetical protein
LEKAVTGIGTHADAEDGRGCSTISKNRHLRESWRASNFLYSTLTIYLLTAIGFKGGVAIHEAGLGAVWLPALTAVVLGGVIPLWTYPVLRTLGKFSMADAGTFCREIRKSVEHAQCRPDDAEDREKLQPCPVLASLVSWRRADEAALDFDCGGVYGLASDMESFFASMILHARSRQREVRSEKRPGLHHGDGARVKGLVSKKRRIPSSAKISSEQI